MPEKFEDQLNRYFEDAFQQITVDENAVLRNPAEIITSFTDGQAGALIASFEFTPLDVHVQPLKRICEPGQQGDCWMEQKKINGKMAWVWVCNCRPL